MNCELAHEGIVLGAYGELPDDATHELDRHLAACPACAQERDQFKALKLLADAYPLEEPHANLVARSRIRLEEALDALPPKRWIERLLQNLRNNAAGLQSAPVAATLLLLIGAGAGSIGGYYVAQSRVAQVGNPPAVSQDDPQVLSASGVQVANISSIVRQPNSEMVEVRFNKLVPGKITGSLDSDEVRKYLMMASEDDSSSDIRDNSVSLLAEECRAGHKCQPSGIREALMFSLRNDRNAGVRHKALEGLQPYVAQDIRVRDAVLEALLNDADPRIRTDAIGILEPVEADTSVRQVLRSVANSDRNPGIRLVSRKVLSQVPEFQ